MAENGEDNGGGCGSGEEQSSESKLGGVGASALDSGTTTDVGSSDGSGDAWASNRESDEGPAEGVEFARWREGNRCEVGDCVMLNDSSTSARGGPGGIGCGCSVTTVDLRSLSGSDTAETFLKLGLRLLTWLDCVQSSTSSM